MSALLELFSEQTPLRLLLNQPTTNPIRTPHSQSQFSNSLVLMTSPSNTVWLVVELDFGTLVVDVKVAIQAPLTVSPIMPEIASHALSALFPTFKVLHHARFVLRAPIQNLAVRHPVIHALRELLILMWASQVACRALRALTLTILGNLYAPCVGRELPILSRAPDLVDCAVRGLTRAIMVNLHA
jgi:hypothetical protein